MATHGLIIDGWHPWPKNKLIGVHFGTRSRRKHEDRTMVGVYARNAALIPQATGKRRVRLRIVLGPGQRACDPDAYWLSLLDALKHAGLIVNDSRQYVELDPVAFDRGEKRRTEILLTDLPEEMTT